MHVGPRSALLLRTCASAFGRLALFLTFALTACASDPKVAIVSVNGADRAALRVELADSAAARQVGLMYRRHLDQDAGMLFVFPASSRQTFWMKNTFIPLDMIFADDAGRIVGIVAKAEPQSESHLTVDAPAQYVLEVNGGFCSRHRVALGDRLKFLGFQPRARN